MKHGRVNVHYKESGRDLCWTWPSTIGALGMQDGFLFEHVTLNLDVQKGLPLLSVDVLKGVRLNTLYRVWDWVCGVHRFRVSGLRNLGVPFWAPRMRKEFYVGLRAWVSCRSSVD